MRIETQAARNTDPVTSHIAAEAITKSGRRNTDAQKVLAFVIRHEGDENYPMTGAEIAKGLSYDYPYEDWPREKAMKRLGDLKGIKVQHSERRGCTALKNASVCVTWKLI